MVYTLYTVIAGMIMTGIWILAHECGHGAFSPSKKVNNLVGFVLHSSLLVPYYSWKISHSHHHKATGDLQRDTVYVPHSREYVFYTSTVPSRILDLFANEGSTQIPHEIHLWPRRQFAQLY
jgi:fatty acid desaturase